MFLDDSALCSRDVAPAALAFLAPLARLAETVCALAGDEPDIAQRALAACLLNRWRLLAGQRRGMAEAPSAMAELETVCRQALRDEGAAAGPARPPGDARFCRALATVCLLWSGDGDDPTHGATRCHRHDQLPAWAAAEQPLALIGRRFFYD